MRCPECGQENPEGFRLCGMCGSPLAHAASQQRKLATMLFCDMSGSTAMGERVDAESVREMMFAYFHEMRAAIERHGGTVEKFIGDAVMAVFGVPTAHEDDALRACRAASEMQERLTELNTTLASRYGSTIALRIGVNSGEVVAGEGSERQALVTGDAVNVAARLEQSAAPGEILIGDATFRLVRDAVEAEPVAPLALKGKSEPLPAYRLDGVLAAALGRARRLDTPLVGRSQELALLQARLEQARSGTPTLVTVVGEPGVGKSRLTAELIAVTEGFRVLSGRCLPYGEGITYWPIAEIVRQAASIHDEHTREQALARIAALAGEDADATAQALGLAEGEAGTAEIALAVAHVLARLAGAAPLLVLVDDIHWAEDALLELLARLPESSGEAALAVLCLARPELLERSEAWVVDVQLEPLEERETTTLVEQLLRDAAVSEAVTAQIAKTAAGNALFVEEIVGMLVEEGLLERRQGRWVADPKFAHVVIPPTLRELLGARLDRMPGGERGALERGAIEGLDFHRGAVVALSEPGDRPSVSAALSSLVEREVLRPAAAAFVDEGAYRFRHILIRDAAYEAIPKRTRAELHEGFAGWLEEKARDRASEYDEILGYHLERAFRYREELGPPTAADRDVAERAADRLERAGRRALDRRDSPATVNLLARAADLRVHESARRLELLQLVGEELGFMMELERADEVLCEVLDGSAALGDDRLGTHAAIWLAVVRFFSDPDFGVLEMLGAVDDAETTFRRLGDNSGLARAHDWRAFAYSHLGRFADSEREARAAIELFRESGDRRLTVEQFWYLGWAAAYGPTPVDLGVRQCRAILDEAGDDPGVDGHTRYSLARLEAMAGRFDDARRLADEAREIFERTGMLFTLWHAPCLAAIELLEGDEVAAERELRRSLEPLEGASDFPTLTTVACQLTGLLVTRNRLNEADELLEHAARWAPKDQPIQAARWSSARARVLVRRGDPRAESAGHEAVRLADTTDYLDLQGDCRLVLGDVLRLTGQSEAATAHVRAALELYESKGNVPAAAKARAVLGGS